jgi:hypothetical protein
MKINEDIAKGLLVEANEELAKLEIKEGFAGYRHSETQDNKYVWMLADFKKEITELRRWIAYLESVISAQAEATVDKTVETTE